MSGHSKWAKIKRQKGANDAKRGALFTKLGKNITITASEGGGDPDTNFALRLAIDKAKAANMPSNNIERAVKKGTGDGKKLDIQKVTYEALGPGGVGLLIDTQTDNTNRTVSELRKLLETNGAKMVTVNSVAWQFVEQGLITIAPAKLQKSEKFGIKDSYEAVDIEEAQLELLEIEGIKDILEGESEDEDGKAYTTLEVFTEKNDFAKVLGAIESLLFKVESAELVKVATEQLEGNSATTRKIEKLVEILEDHDDVDSVWNNLADV
ncbi:MAG: YebC/PmpR family DNA-binding transcriptional regulator [Candidatus Dojkabacteria bacterium]